MNSTVVPGFGIAVLMSITPPLVIVGLSFREGKLLGISNSSPDLGCSKPGEPMHCYGPRDKSIEDLP